MRLLFLATFTSTLLSHVLSGAEKSDPAHWSLQSMTPQAVPSGKVANQNPIDAFVGLKLIENGWELAPAAPTAILLRRVFFDLHGLPPPAGPEGKSFATPLPESVTNAAHAFRRTGSDADYVALVDALLDSPRHGERWARHWLDTIHFADTHGFEHDILRENAWRYRDYVIESLNRDTPWPRFIREQLAADVFFPDDPELVAALGFLGAGPYDQSAAATAPKSFEYLDRDDLVTQTMGAFVSTTANCARCHAHKFDPITQEDYFALQAVFAGVGKGDISYDADPTAASQRRRWSDLQAACAGGNADVLLQPENAELVRQWGVAAGGPVNWQPFVADSFLSSHGATLSRLEDGSILASGHKPETDIYTLTGPGMADRAITGIRLEVLPHDSLPLKGPGRNDNGNQKLTEFEVTVFSPGAAQAEVVKIVKATANFDQKDWDIGKSLDGNLKTAWGIHPRVGEAHQAVFVFEKPLQVPAQGRLSVQLKQFHASFHLLGRFRLSVSDSPGDSLRAVPLEISAVLAIPEAQRTREQQVQLAAYVLPRRAEEELARLPAPVKVYAAGKVAENERGVIRLDRPRSIQVLNRGELSQPRQEVAPGALCAISTLPFRFTGLHPHNEGARRAALADWIAAPQNPLTWRSIVNRVWHYHFGRGLCDTPGDFGKMGGAPSHPQLLDWLALWFRDDAAGSLKKLHRLIVTSQTYRQQSAMRTAPAAVDPENRLLWRMNRSRLDAESIRDAVLTASGVMDFKMGGPSVALFQQGPGPQLTPSLNYAAFDWNTPGATRRSIYRVVWRGIADPFMEALDFPDMGMLSPVRGFSASSLQALALLNNSFVLTHAEKLSRSIVEKFAEPSQQIASLFQSILQRDPSAEEAADFEQLTRQHSLAAAARVIFNSNEFLFLD